MKFLGTFLATVLAMASLVFGLEFHFETALNEVKQASWMPNWITSLLQTESWIQTNKQTQAKQKAYRKKKPKAKK